jgi:SAM-dependent methyltransferase
MEMALPGNKISPQISEPFCIICESRSVKLHHYPPNIFNDKAFRYYKCSNCQSVSISPLPNKDDFDLMYGEHDHSYLSVIPEGQIVQHDFNFPAYHQRKYQLDFFKEARPFVAGNKLLDFACGNGFYLAYSQALGFDSIGIEFNQKFAEKLRGVYGLRIHTIEELQKVYSGCKFDIIHLGHILEHLIEPKSVILWLSKFAHSRTLFLFDGPLENNPCLSRLIIDVGSKIKKKKHNNYAPQHLSFTNFRSQLGFFESAGFETLRYEVLEQPWPLPQHPQWSTVSSLARFALSRTSIYLSNLFKAQGNLFHYAGRLKES